MGFEKSDLVDDVLVHCCVFGTGWFLRSLPAQTILWFSVWQEQKIPNLHRCIYSHGTKKEEGLCQIKRGWSPGNKESNKSPFKDIIRTIFNPAFRAEKRRNQQLQSLTSYRRLLLPLMGENHPQSFSLSHGSPTKPSPVLSSFTADSVSKQGEWRENRNSQKTV